MIYVIYRILYGTDFLERSMRSVYDEADRIFVGYSSEPWSKPKNFPKITRHRKESSRSYTGKTLIRQMKKLKYFLIM